MIIEEIICFYAMRGDTEMIKVLRQIQEDMKLNDYADYDPQTDSESESGEDAVSSTDEDQEDSDNENNYTNPSMNGFCSVV
jgi:hypothetical protein|tara:strand:+ start:3187 stop:3429 length:243 start_codon:yes stop_codon:yes gene_type:complete